MIGYLTVICCESKSSALPKHRHRSTTVIAGHEQYFLRKCQHRIILNSFCCNTIFNFAQHTVFSAMQGAAKRLESSQKTTLHFITQIDLFMNLFECGCTACNITATVARSIGEWYILVLDEEWTEKALTLSSTTTFSGRLKKNVLWLFCMCRDILAVPGLFLIPKMSSFPLGIRSNSDKANVTCRSFQLWRKWLSVLSWGVVSSLMSATGQMLPVSMEVVSEEKGKT